MRTLSQTYLIKSILKSLPGGAQKARFIHVCMCTMYRFDVVVFQLRHRIQETFVLLEGQLIIRVEWKSSTSKTVYKILRNTYEYELVRY